MKIMRKLWNKRVGVKKEDMWSQRRKGNHERERGIGAVKNETSQIRTNNDEGQDRNIWLIST